MQNAGAPVLRLLTRGHGYLLHVTHYKCNKYNYKYFVDIVHFHLNTNVF